MRAPVARVITLPARDHAFGELVRDALATHDIRSPADLEAWIRPLVPSIVVRERELSGERGVWYAYRDGTYHAERDEQWWVEGDVASAVWSIASGRLLKANESLAALLGGPVDDLVGRHFTSFVESGADEQVALLFRAVVELGEARSIAKIRTATGPGLVEYVVVKRGDELDAWYRPVALARP